MARFSVTSCSHRDFLWWHPRLMSCSTWEVQKCWLFISYMVLYRNNYKEHGFVIKIKVNPNSSRNKLWQSVQSPRPEDTGDITNQCKAFVIKLKVDPNSSCNKLWQSVQPPRPKDTGDITNQCKALPHKHHHCTVNRRNHWLVLLMSPFHKIKTTSHF